MKGEGTPCESDAASATSGQAAMLKTGRSVQSGEWHRMPSRRINKEGGQPDGRPPLEF
jgi:hypothetical protein